MLAGNKKKEDILVGMAEKMLAVLIGILFTACLVYLTPDRVRNTVVNYAPFFIGGAVTGFVSRNKGWFYGVVVGLIITIIQAALLINMVSFGKQMIFGWDQFIFAAIITMIVTGIGGFVGQLIRQKIGKEK